MTRINLIPNIAIFHQYSLNYAENTKIQKSEKINIFLFFNIIQAIFKKNGFVWHQTNPCYQVIVNMTLKMIHDQPTYTKHDHVDTPKSFFKWI